VSSDGNINIFVDNAPVTATFSPVSQSTPQQAVPSVDVTFSAPIDPTTFTTSALSLTSNGGTNLFGGGVSIQSLGGDSYQITGLSTLNTAVGDYVLSLNTTAVKDLDGNLGAGTPSVSWQVQPTIFPAAFSNVTLPSTIIYGESTVVVSGTVASGTVVPGANEFVSITLDGVTVNAPINSQGDFAASLNTATLPTSSNPYQIVYSYAGDFSLSSATNSSTTTLTVNAVIAPVPSYITISNDAVYTWNSINGALNLISGTLTFTQDQATSNDTTDPLVNLTVTGPNATVVFDSNEHLAGISLSDGAKATIAQGSTTSTLYTGMLSIDSSSTLDVTTNIVYIDYAAAGQPSPNAAIRAAITEASGTYGTAFTGDGITSSTAESLNAALYANGTTPAYTVGYADGSDPYLNGEGPAAGIEEIRFTLLGDLNLDGVVNSADFILFADSFGQSGGAAAAYYHGDVNYDGTVNSEDFILFADNFGKSLGSVSATNGGIVLNQNQTPISSSSSANSSSNESPLATTSTSSENSSASVAQTTAIAAPESGTPPETPITGQYQSLVTNGQNRALVVWQRLIYPNGNSIVLDGMPGTDESGAAGLQDKVDYHLDKLAEGTALSTALAYAGNLARNPNSSSGNNGQDVIGDTVAQQANRIGEKIIDRELDVQPTFTIRQGWPLRVLVNKDMILEPYVP
jgi:hypothetical protein